jgi:hypothetical protein
MKVTPNTRFFRRSPKFVTVFEIGTCESCGKPIQEANAFGVSVKDIPTLLKMGVKEIDFLPPEIQYNDVTQKCDCQGCNR